MRRPPAGHPPRHCLCPRGCLRVIHGNLTYHTHHRAAGRRMTLVDIPAPYAAPAIAATAYLMTIDWTHPNHDQEQP